MTASTLNAFLRFNMNSPGKIILWGVFSIILTVILLITSKIIDIFLPLYNAHSPLYLWLYPIWLAVFLGLIIRKNLLQAFSIVLALITLIGTTLSGVYFEITPHIEKLKLEVLPKRYDKCQLDAQSKNEEVVLRICDRYDRIGYFDGIVYDGSDQMRLPDSLRSKSWHYAAKKFDYFELFNFEAQKIGEHFYYVKFDIQSPKG